MNKLKQGFTGFVRGRNFSSAVLTAVIICAVVFVNIITYTLTSAFSLYIHKDEEYDLSISSSNDALFAEYIEGGRKVDVIFCSYEDSVKNNEKGAAVYRTAKYFEERYPEFIKLKFVNALTQLDSDGAPYDLSQFTQREGEYINENSVIFSTETNYRVLTDSFSITGYANFYTLDSQLTPTSYNGEEVFASSVLWALQPAESQQIAYFTTGHGETSNAILYTILSSAGYLVKELNLRKNDVPEDADLVIISNPVVDFERGAEGSSLWTEYDRLVDYRSRGGKLMVIVDPLINKPFGTLSQFIGEYGLSFETAESGEKALVRESSNAITADGFTLVAEFADSEVASAMRDKIVNRAGTENPRVILRNVASIAIDPNFAEARPLLVASPSSTLEAGGVRVNSDGDYAIAAYSRYSNNSTEDSAIVVMSDGMLTASDAIVTDRYSNKDFLYSLFDVFFEKGDMPYGCRSVIYQHSVLENLTVGTARIYTAVLIAIPVVIGILGGVVLVRRKNR